MKIPPNKCTMISILIRKGGSMISPVLRSLTTHWRVPSFSLPITVFTLPLSSFGFQASLLRRHLSLLLLEKGNTFFSVSAADPPIINQLRVVFVDHSEPRYYSTKKRNETASPPIAGLKWNKKQKRKNKYWKTDNPSEKNSWLRLGSPS